MDFRLFCRNFFGLFREWLQREFLIHGSDSHRFTSYGMGMKTDTFFIQDFSRFLRCFVLHMNFFRGRCNGSVRQVLSAILRPVLVDRSLFFSFYSQILSTSRSRFAWIICDDVHSWTWFWYRDDHKLKWTEWSRGKIIRGIFSVIFLYCEREKIIFDTRRSFHIPARKNYSIIMFWFNNIPLFVVRFYEVFDPRTGKIRIKRRWLITLKSS